MNSTINFAAGAAVGALAMYFFDPDRGNRRRKMLADQLNHFGHVKADAWDATIRDTRNRLQGLWHDIAERFSPDDVSDEALMARVRSEMGRCVTNPSAIDVDSRQGRIILTGDILANEIGLFMDCVRKVNGVHGVTNQLNVHGKRDGVPSLQGEPRTTRSNLGMRPGPALAAGVVGLGLAIYGRTRKDRVGGALGAFGMGLALKSFKQIEGTRKFAERLAA